MFQKLAARLRCTRREGEDRPTTASYRPLVILATGCCGPRPTEEFEQRTLFHLVAIICRHYSHSVSASFTNFLYTKERPHATIQLLTIIGDFLHSPSQMSLPLSPHTHTHNSTRHTNDHLLPMALSFFRLTYRNQTFFSGTRAIFHSLPNPQVAILLLFCSSTSYFFS